MLLIIDLSLVLYYESMNIQICLHWEKLYSILIFDIRFEVLLELALCPCYMFLLKKEDQNDNFYLEICLHF